MSSTAASKLLELELKLNESFKKIKFESPVASVDYPLDYAYGSHAAFTEKYCRTTKKILFLGINPGPGAMRKTGVPFGDVTMVKEWLNIDGVQVTEKDLLGNSGHRLWTLFKDICGSPETFFKSAFIYNYCPVVMFNDKGANVTPEGIKGNSLKQLQKICDNTLYEVIKLLGIETVVAIGKYPEKRALKVLKEKNVSNVKVIYLEHSSCRNPNNANWENIAKNTLVDNNLIQYFKT